MLRQSRWRFWPWLPVARDQRKVVLVPVPGLRLNAAGLRSPREKTPARRPRGSRSATVSRPRPLQTGCVSFHRLRTRNGNNSFVTTTHWFLLFSLGSRYLMFGVNRPHESQCRGQAVILLPVV